jgi:tRNA (Thr-GGU) A37 N-methylase
MATKRESVERMRTDVKDSSGGRFRPFGVIRPALKARGKAPKPGATAAPDAWLEVGSYTAEGLDGLLAGHDIIVVTWLDPARRNVLKVHPRSDQCCPLTGVFATRSSDRPNLVGLHRVTVRRSSGIDDESAPLTRSTGRRTLT